MKNILEVKNIQKVYENGTVANKNVSFALRKGEIHAIVGENGAGKSTLMKILFGMERPSSGEILIEEKPVEMESTAKAISMGIGMVHQHFMLVPSFTIAENVILGDEPGKGLRVDRDQAVKMTQKASDVYRFDLNPLRKIQDVSVGTKQKVEILKALIRGAKILILDEPTAVLTPQETEELFVQLQLLKEQGHTIIFISHKLKEVFRICDRVTVIRKGETLGTYELKEIDEAKLSNLMVGKEFSSLVHKKVMKTGERVLQVEDLSYEFDGRLQALKGITFSLPFGRILGVAGVEGNGQETLVNILSGEVKDYEGSAKLKEREIKNLSIYELRKSGLGYVPEDRMTKGIAVTTPIYENLMANRFDEKEWNKGVFLHQKKILSYAKDAIDEYQILANGPFQKIESLSGGNIQKVVVAREFTHNPEFLLLDQPTRGVDIGAAHLIRQKATELRDQGKAILLFSADLQELLGISDHLMVMYSGEIVGYFSTVEGLTEEKLGLYMLGIEKMSADEIRRNRNEL